MTDPMIFLNLLGCVVAGLCAVLIALIGWLGNKMSDKLAAIEKSHESLANSLYSEVKSLDRRVTIVETKCEGNHSS